MVGGSEVHSVVATKTVNLGELPCTPSELVVDGDEMELLAHRLGAELEWGLRWLDP